MKRTVSILIVLTMVLSVFLTSCNMISDEVIDGIKAESSADTEQETEKSTEKVTDEIKKDDPAPDPDPNPEPGLEPSGYVYSYSYINDATFAKIKNVYENEKPSVNAYAFRFSPFVLADLFGMSGAEITQISIPVWGTGKADVDGNYVFTLSIFKNDLDSIKKSSAVHTYPVKIKGEIYGLRDSMSGVYRFIDVDLSEYGIKLEEDEALAVGDVNDTLIPAYLGADPNNTNPIYNILKTEAHQMLSFSGRCGKTQFVHQTNSVFFNFTLKRTYDDKVSYEVAKNEDTEFAKMIETLKKEYGGLNLSVFGDSISTYAGISNNTAYNSTIGGNAVWYNQSNINSSLFFDHTYTYWGSMLRKLEMELCVNNSWSGDSLGSGRFKERAKQLHNNDGDTPDVILVYFGVNDCGGTGDVGRFVGDLITLLENRGSKSEHEVVSEWYEGVMEKNGNCSNFDELYATMLNIMMQEYPEAKIVCIGLTYSSAKNNTWIPLYNQAIEVIAGYLGITYVNQQNVISKDNYHAYMHDSGTSYYLHPNAYGHRLIFEEIVRTLYREIQSKNA